jgi:hypothetical protein
MYIYKCFKRGFIIVLYYLRESWTKTEYHGWQYLATALLLIVHSIYVIFIYISVYVEIKCLYLYI